MADRRAAEPPRPPPAGAGGRRRLAGRRLRLARRARCSSRAARRRPAERLGGGEDLPLRPAPGARVPGVGAHAGADVPGLLDHAQPTGAYPGDPPAAGRWRWAGWCGKPVRLTREMLEALPRVTYTVKHHCVEGWTAIATWTGVPVSSVVGHGAADGRGALPALRLLRQRLLQRLGPDERHAPADHPGLRLQRPAPARANHGAPLRLYSPIKLGYKLTKYLTEMTFTARAAGRLLGGPGVPVARRHLSSVRDSGLDRDLGGAVGQIGHLDPPRTAADLAILDVFLVAGHCRGRG